MEYLEKPSSPSTEVNQIPEKGESEEEEAISPKVLSNSLITIDWL